MIHDKAEIWDLCLQNNIFLGIQNNMFPKIQEIFEDTINDNMNVSKEELLKLISINIKSVGNTLNYKDLLPKEKVVDINFNDDVQDEPLVNIDKILEEKQKERNLISLDHKETNSVININQLAQETETYKIEKETKKNNDFENNVYKILENQNDCLVKLLEYQIKILEYLQKK